MTTTPTLARELADTLTTTEQALALNDLLFELEGLQLITREDTIGIISAASVSVRTFSARERACCPHTVLTGAESLGSKGQVFPPPEDVTRAVPRDPRNPSSRRTKLLPAYREALQLVAERSPEAALAIKLYTATLRDECARARVRARDLRAQLEGGAA
ncbi:MAG: hypothetical protein ACXIUP_11930 [Microcella sp.]